MLIRFLRFWRGTLEFQVSGKYLERFLNLAARARIPIWDGHRSEHSFCGKTLSRHEKELRSIAEKVQLQWEKGQDFGMTHIGKNYGKRIGILSGAVLLLGLSILSQQFIWEITVNGNETVSQRLILECVEQSGLRKAVWKGSLDVLEIADQITLQFEEISWAAVNLRGTVAEIEIMERVQPPELVNEESACNVTAEKAGQLVELEVYDGKKMLKVGDTVKQGQLIASGILTDKLGRTIYRHARAKAVVEYLHNEVVEIPLRSTELIATDTHKNTYRLFLGELSLPLNISNLPNSDHFSTEPGLVESGFFRQNDGKSWFYSVRNRKLMLGNIPLTLQIQQYISAETTEILYTEEQAKELALLNMAQLSRRLEQQGIEIVSSEMAGTVKKGMFVLSADFTCREDVAREVEIIRDSQEEKQ